MIGVLVNTITVIVGSCVGLLLKKGIPQRLTSAIMLGIGLCTIYIGIDGMMAGENTLVLIVSMVLGALVGTLLDLDGKIQALGDWIEGKFSHKQSLEEGTARISLAQGFVTASLLFCVGSMTIVGSLNAGISGDNEMLFTKSLLDLISSSMLAASLGLGVLLSAAFVLVFQGALVLLASVLAPFLTTAAIAELTCCGSVLILALGLNLIGLTKIKVADYLPALVFVPILSWALGFLPI
ncbi:MAG: DUF554 domain-containing protein [Candidatus Onthomonas sp.]|nr:DUF554 domain-containing protein [Candidatus Onthomonas sp.]